jgi:hypothetical protein
MSHGIGGNGPWVYAAFFAEKVLRETDGVTSYIRVIDRITTTIIGQNAPAIMPPAMLNLNLVIGLRSDSARGSYEITIRPEPPSGLKASQPSINYPVLFEGEERGAQMVIELNYQAEEQGLHWFDILLEDHVMTRVPLRIVYQRLASGS